MADDTKPEVDELEREVDQTRAQVSHTLDELQSQVSETIDEWRSRLTAEEISKELKNYARGFVANMGRSATRRMRDNPASAVAMGAAAAWPVYKLARKIPLPVYVIGAGVALMRPLVGSHGDERQDRDYEGISRSGAYERDRGTMARAKDALSEGASRVADAAGRAQEAVSSSVSHAAGKVSDAADRAYRASGMSGSSQSRRTGEYSRTSATSHRAAGVNPWLLGTLGLAVGAAMVASGARPARDLWRGSGAGRRSDERDSERFEGARAAVARAYRVARREAEAQGMSADEADTVARAFVLKMSGRGSMPSGGQAGWVSSGDRYGAADSSVQGATFEDADMGGDIPASPMKSAASRTSAGSRSAGAAKPGRRKKPG